LFGYGILRSPNSDLAADGTPSDERDTIDQLAISHGEKRYCSQLGRVAHSEHLLG
jgi:hypothetical protein